MSKKHYDEFDDEPKFKGEKIMSLLSLGGRGFAAGAICAALVLLGLVLWIAYPSSDNAGGEVPIIRADAEGYKTTPDEPGGMDIPHRDSTIFSAEGNPDGKVENLLADNTAEKPMEKSELFAGLNTQTEGMPPQPAAEPMKEPVASEDLVPVFENKSANAAKEEITEVAPPADQQQAAVTPAPASEPADDELSAAEPAAGAATATPKAIASGTHFVQLASIQDSSKAATEFKKLQAKYSSLSNMDYRLQEAQIAGKGTFYRIQAGPVSKADAESACAAIKAQAGGSCLIVAK